MLLVALHHGQQLGLETRREVGVAVGEQLVELLLRGVAPREHLGAQDARREVAPVAALVVPARSCASARARAAPPRARRSRARAPPRAGGSRRRSARRSRGSARSQSSGSAARVGERAERVELGHHRVDRALAIERVAAPARGEVAVLDERARGVEQRRARAARVGPARAPAQQPAHALGRIGERALEPVVERALEQRAPPRRAPRSRTADRRPPRPAARWSRSAQNAWIVAMRASSSCSSAASSRRALVAARARSRRARGLELRAQPQLHLARGLLGERERDDRGRASRGRCAAARRCGPPARWSCRCRPRPRRRASRRGARRSGGARRRRSRAALTAAPAAACSGREVGLVLARDAQLLVRAADGR